MHRERYRLLNAIARWLVPVIAVGMSSVVGELAHSDDRKPARPIYDTVVTWEPAGWMDRKLKPKMLFYVGGHFVGFGKAGFDAVVEKIRRLPSGTSVVWGPDCKKWANGSGDELSAVDFFPEQWKHFEQAARERGVVLSSGEFPTAAAEDEPPELPTPAYVEPSTPQEKGDVVLRWKPEGGKEVPIYDYWKTRSWPVYLLDGRESGRGPSGFLDTLKALRQYADGSRLRVAWRNGQEPPGIRTFSMEFREVVAAKRFQLVVESKKNAWPMFANCPARCRFEWRNFESKATPLAEVIYLVEGKVAGTGDSGFDAVLKRLRELPRDAYVEYPQYHLHPQAFFGQSKYRQEFESQDLVPFGKRRTELDNLVKGSGFAVKRIRVFYWPKPKYEDRVDENEKEGWFLASLLRFAVIVRDGAKPAQADVIISWTKTRDERRHANSEATYLYNGEKIGSGTRTFLAVLKRLESLKDGATVRIDPVCIRTHAPFACPIVWKGQRHFETTGKEPFRGLVDLLAELAERKRLHVEVIPDEGKN